jgi:hypothetical protein
MEIAAYLANCQKAVIVLLNVLLVGYSRSVGGHLQRIGRREHGPESGADDSAMRGEVRASVRPWQSSFLSPNTATFFVTGRPPRPICRRTKESWNGAFFSHRITRRQTNSDGAREEQTNAKSVGRLGKTSRTARTKLDRALSAPAAIQPNAPAHRFLPLLH